jgi:hypothetical protein
MADKDTWRTLLVTLDLLTESKLALEFGVKPGSRSMVEAVDKIDRIKRRLTGKDNVFGSKTLYGKYVYKMPEGTYGFENVTLIARSKLRVTIDNTAFMAMVAGTKAVGLFPSLSAMWDLVPFSFVVDWVLNMGDRLQAVDDAALLLAINIHWCIHSYSIWVDIPDDLLEDHGLTAFSDTEDDKPQLKVYIREKSHITPMPRNSSYDFLEGTSKPPIELVGSLAYQVFGKH